MPKYIVAVDLSELSRKALDKTVQMTQGGKIDLLHILLHVLPAHVETHTPKEILERIQASEEGEAVTTLKEWMATVPEERRGEIILKRGQTAKVICDFSEGYDMLVVSTHGRKGWHQMFLGSVAEQVVRYAKVPVLVVR